LGGFNVWGQFHRPWWIRLTFANGEDLRIVKPDEDAINRLHDAIRSVMS